jgi:hypothetical protein
MTSRQLFFLRGKLLGDAPREAVIRMGQLQLPLSYLFVCGVSGEVFARCPVVTSSGAVRPWQVQTMLDIRQGPSHSWIPGSIWTSWDTDFIAAFPDAVLQWELERHLDYYESKL